MRNRWKVFTVMAMLFVIITGGLIVLRSYESDIAVLEDQVKEKELTLRRVQHEQSTLAAELKSKDTNGYIIERARGLGYLMPGEIRFVVTNPEVLYDVPEEEAPAEQTEEQSL